MSAHPEDHDTTSGASDRLPILGVSPDEVAPLALVVGDPARARGVAALLDDAREIGSSREYVTLTGSFGGRPVTVASHGVGAAGAAICFEELARAGVTRIVRAGTCAGLQAGVDAGHLVVGTAAVRDDGVTDRLVDPRWPAVADAALTLELERAARATGVSTHVGIVQTVANFYPGHHETQPGWLAFHHAGAVALEMEFSALLVVASHHRIAAGGLFTVDGNMLEHDEDMSDYDPATRQVADGKDAMLRAALEALTA